MQFYFCVINHEFIYIAGSSKLQFQPLFMKVTESKKFSFRISLTHKEILGWQLEEDPETMFSTRDKVLDNPQWVCLFEQNPCHLGFSFTGVREGKSLKATMHVVCHFYRLMCSQNCRI